ncbi:MAG: tetratricopeptide repeat protein, partial [Desulfobacterales bacterium]
MHSIPEVNHSRSNSLIPTVCILLVCLALGLLAAGCTQPVVHRPGTEIPQAVEKTTEQRAYAAMESGEYLAGIRLYEQVLRKDPGNAEALYMLGYAYGQLGEVESEIAYYRAAVQSGYRNEQIFHNLGKACLAINRPEEAIAAFDSGLALNPLSADNHFGLGMAYQKKS